MLWASPGSVAKEAADAANILMMIGLDADEERELRDLVARRTDEALAKKGRE